MPIALIVDDEPEMREFATLALRADGWRVLQANHGLQAFEILQQRDDIDLLVTDVQMPVMTGPELVASISRVKPRLPTLYITGYVDRLFAGQASLDANAAFLEKPFTPVELTEAASLLAYGSVRRGATPPGPSASGGVLRRLRGLINRTPGSSIGGSGSAKVVWSRDQ